HVRAVQDRSMGVVVEANDTGVYAFAQGTGIYGQADIGVRGAGTTYGVYGVGLTDPSGGAAYGVYANGNLGASGTKTAVVEFADGKRRAFYCLESPECWF